MTSGDDLRKIETDYYGAGGRGADPGVPRPILEGARRRTYTSRASGRDGVHEMDRVNRLRILVLSGSGGLLGFVLGLFLAMQFRTAPFAALYPFVAAAVGWALVAGIVTLVTRGAGGLGRTVYMPGGSAGGVRREYSFAESLAARGLYEDAVSAFELAVGEHPDDPEPYLRIARICRDHLDDPERSARWFRRGRDESGMGAGRRRVVTRELVELYRRIGQPTRAAPELARLAELHPDTDEGRWAAEELVEVKRLIARDGG